MHLCVKFLVCVGGCMYDYSYCLLGDYVKYYT